MNGACTIVSPNYLPYARTLAKSYIEQHPADRFSVLVVADIQDKAVFGHEAFDVIFLEQIGLKNVKSLAMKYDILELNTNVKPTFMKFLLQQPDLENLIYLDPDIYVYRPLEPVFELLKSNDVVLTPHITSPVPKSFIPPEQDFLRSGTYNLGFIAVRAGRTTQDLLDWWEARCLEQGFNELGTGLFVDQKWMNLAPTLFTGVRQCKHPGCNMAYWNLHERVLVWNGEFHRVNGGFDLYFYHFSGIVIDDSRSLSRYSDSYTLTSRPDLGKIFSDYKGEVVRHRCVDTDDVPYGYDEFSDGTPITIFARRIFAAHEADFTDNPFMRDGSFYSFACSKGLVQRKRPAKSASSREFDRNDRRVWMINGLLRLTLCVLGPCRYELLMKYLAHIAVLRNQGVFIVNGAKDND